MKRLLSLFICFFTITLHAQTVGWFYGYPGNADGYILFSPSNSPKTFLLDKCGKKIHEWVSFYDAGLAVYLQEDGSLLRCGNTNNSQFQGGGQGGILEKYDWNGFLTWSYKISDSEQCQHHDAIQLPNGNIMAISWEYHSKADAQANGRVSLGTKMWSEKIVEIQPIGTDSGIIVWQWRAWDHLVQDADSTKPNYGVVAEHPELLDLNLGTLSNSQSDWLHFNGLDYNEELDQIMVSCHNLDEFYIIDHSTTMEEAAGHTGGNSGMGGDLMYRWGNPQNYGRGTSDDRKLFQQHNAHWIADDAGEIMLFNNGVGRPGTDYSSVEVLTLPPMVGANYQLETDSAYLPKEQDWIYTANPLSSFFSLVMGGAQRLPNGNTLICNATSGKFIEVDSLGNDLWKYVNPIDLNGNTPQGDQPFQNSCFRVTWLPPDYAGFDGQVLTPGEPLELNPDNYICPTISTSVSSIHLNSESVIYPNPFHQAFSISVPVSLKAASLEVHDVTGRLLYSEYNITSSPHAALNFTADLPAGMVVVSVKDASQNFSWNSRALVQ
jgi:hypothetical protein